MLVESYLVNLVKAWGGAFFADVGPADPSLVIDLLNLQWWQGLIGIIGILGLSPAPWLLGLATNKIQFTAAAEREKGRALAKQDEYHKALMDAQKERYSDLERANAKNEEAAATQQARADAATDAIFDMKDVVEANTHVLKSVNQVAREATGQDGR